MPETVIQIDGKFAFVAPGEIIKAVVVQGKLVNLLTKVSQFVVVLHTDEGERKSWFAKCQICGAESERWSPKELLGLPSGIGIHAIECVKGFEAAHRATGCCP